MKPIWLLEANVTGLPTEKWQAEIRRQGMQSRIVKMLPHASRPGDIAGSEELPHDARVIFMGTLPLMRYLRQHRRWLPGAVCNVQNLACSTYYAWFGKFLVNQRYAFLPVAEVLRTAKDLMKNFGSGGEIFVRPDSVDKSFPGALADEDTLQGLVGPVLYDPTTLVVVAQPQSIGHEWRLVVRDTIVVTASQYRTPEGPSHVADCPDAVKEFAHYVLNQVSWRPDPLFIMDVGETSDGLRMIELNSFSCSGPYLCDVGAMVAAASEIAMSV